MNFAQTKYRKVSFLIRSSGFRDEYLAKLILSIHAQDAKVPNLYEIIVLGATCLDPIRFAFDYVEAKDDAINHRFGRMLNQLVRIARNEISVFLDDDMELAPHWMEAMQCAWMQHDDWDFNAFRIIQHERWWDFRRWYDWASYNIKTGNVTLKPWDEPANISTYIGGGCTVRKTEVPHYYPDVAGGEEWAYFRKAYKSGLRLRVWPVQEHAVAWHYQAPAGRHEYVGPNGEKANDYRAISEYLGERWGPDEYLKGLEHLPRLGE